LIQLLCSRSRGRQSNGTGWLGSPRELRISARTRSHTSISPEDIDERRDAVDLGRDAIERARLEKGGGEGVDRRTTAATEVLSMLQLLDGSTLKHRQWTCSDAADITVGPWIGGDWIVI